MISTNVPCYANGKAILGVDPLLSSRRANCGILIIGGGEAARCAAEAARAADIDVSITIVGEEPWLPYDRPPLSKSALTDPTGIHACQKRDAAFYEVQRIKVLTGRRAEAIDPSGRSVQFDDGGSLSWERLIIATGSRPKNLALPAGIVPIVRTLRTRDDAARLAASLAGGRSIGIVGAGFIGLEVAASARALGCPVIVFERAPSVLARVMPPGIAHDIETVHAERGVSIHTNVAVSVDETGEGNGAIVSARDLADGTETTERCDLLLVAVGVSPNVELAEAAGIAVDDGIVVDASGRTSIPGIFAAGEVTNHPVAGSERHARYESWQVAQSQAAAVGSTAAGVVREYNDLPWFWSDQYDLNIQMLGHVPADAIWVFRGARQSRTFTAFAIASSGLVEAAVSVNAGRDIAGARRLMSRRIAADPAQLADPRQNWNAILSKARA